VVATVGDQLVEATVAATRSRGRRVLTWALVLAVTVGALVAVRITGVADQLEEGGRIHGAVQEAGVFGPVAFVALMSALVPVDVPGALFVVSGTSVFGMAAGIALSVVGGFGACTVGVLASRRLGRAAFERRIPPRLRRFEERFSRRGFWGVVALRTVTYLLPPADWLCGVSSIPTRTVLAGTFVGLIPQTVVLAFVGGALF
jgi:uncharacterized membrane protein YdjX (TVP38/TMEM64 family)